MRTSHKHTRILFALLICLPLVGALLMPGKAVQAVRSAFSRATSATVKAAPVAVMQDKNVQQGKPEPPSEVSVIQYNGPIGPKPNNANHLAAASVVTEVEPNGTFGTASPIGVSSAKIKGNLFPNGDVDFYSFTAAAGDRIYAATMTSFSAGSSTDSQITLLASDGTTVIEFDDDNGSFAGLSSSIAGATIPSAGTYFLKVNDFTAGTTSERPYELWFQIQSGAGAPTPEVEGNDTPATANPLPANGWVSGTRNPAAATEQDWYSMNLNAGDTVYLSLDLDPERDGVTWNGRLGIALFGDAANQILVVDDAGTGDVSPNPNKPSEAMFMTVKTAGTYFAFVDSASAAVGGPTATYHLSVTVLPRIPVGVNCTTYTSTDVPKTIGPGTGLVSSTITVPGSPRIASIRVSLVLNHALMADIDAHLRSPAGNDIGLFTDIGAAATGGQQQMDITFDDDAGIPPSFTVVKGLIIKPELNYRLGWFKGENAGGTWTLDLRDDTAGANGGTLTSWSIEICEEPPLPTCGAGFTQTTVFSSDFESGAAGFTHSGTADEWELGLPATAATSTANPVAGLSTCNSGVNCWKTDLDNTYNVSSSQDLLSPNINLAGLSGPITLSWAQWYQMESANFDHANVVVREVGNPSNSRIVWQFLDATMTDAPGNPTVNVPASSGWSVLRADISGFAGLNVEVVFHLDSDTTVNFAGFAIDDVSVVACQACPAITCPSNITTNTDPGVCTAVVNYTTPVSTGCTVTCTPASGATFVKGTTTVNCTNGGASTCSFTVTVNDNQNPAITCPANISTNTAAGLCSAVVTYTTPTPTDNCPGATAACVPPSGSTFQKGVTTVTCTATDASNNTTPCTFTVTVTDNQNPTITCPASITTNTAAGLCSAVVTYTTPTPTDNCPGATAACVPPSGSTFQKGVTTVTCTATDASNNTTPCTFTVTVVDNQPPTVTCPANISGVPSGVVTYTTPTANDNCPGATVVCSPASGSSFPAGTTTVTCTATDAANLTGSCMFTVTTTNPCTITCPANVVAWTAGTSAPVTYPAPTTTGSGCGTVTCVPASGSTFNVGTTTVTCSSTAGPSCSFTVTVNRLTLGAALADPLACSGPGNKVNGTFSATNTTGAAANVSVSATLSNLVYLPLTAVADQPGAVVVLANVISWTGTLGAGQTVTVSYMAQIADNATPNTQACSVTTATVNNLPVFGSATACLTVNCPAPGPGSIFPTASEASDQKAGSVLVYNIYTSGATSGNTQNTRINITNVHPLLSSFVHLFFVAEGCSIADSYICLTGNQTASFLASDLDPGTTGYIVALAVNSIGCPTSFNYLIGDEYVKFSSGHAANLGAEAFAQLAGGLPACDGNSVTATLNFDGVSYNRVPAVLALDSVGSRADGNDTLLIVNRIGGNLGIGASTLSTLFGILYDDAENSLSFSVSGNCQLRNSLSNNFPRTTPRFETFIPAGRTGWLKIFNQTAAIGITGSAINFNPNAGASAGAFNQGHNLHHLTLTTSSYVIPIFPPSC